MSSPGERLKRLREKCGFATAKDAAVAMGVPTATYTHHEQATQHLPARRAAEYALFFGTSAEYLLFGTPNAAIEHIPVMSPFGDDTGKLAAAPRPPSALTLAQQGVPGDGIAHFGFVALYDEPQGRAAPFNLEGRLCVVAVNADGQEQRLIKVVHNGSRPDRFHLVSVSGGLPMIDQQLVWAAPITALVPTVSG